MTTPRRFESDLPALLADLYLAGTPDYRDDLIQQTARVRQRPAWTFPERWLPVELVTSRVPTTRVPWRQIGVLALIAILLVAALAVYVGSHQQRLPAPFGIAANGIIAYVRDGKLVTQKPDGSGLVTILPASTGQQAASFSRDGSKIVYKDLVGGSVVTSSGTVPLTDIVVADADGSHARTVVKAVVAGNPIWSPDGGWLSYSGLADHAFVVASDGSQPPIDIGTFGAGAWTPSWSPNSKQLAVAAGDGVLWLANRDGTSPRRLTVDDYAELGEKGWSADWSNDGTRLLFGAAKPDEDYALYVVGLDGAKERLVSACANNGVWSPDGNSFAFMHCGTGLGPSVVVADATGSRRRTLPGYYGWYMPAWSPDQMRIAILDDRPGPANEPGPPTIVLLDPNAKAPAISIPAGASTLTEDRLPDYTLTWQRLAPPG